MSEGTALQAWLYITHEAEARLTNVTISNVTAQNSPIVMADAGTLNLIDCHVTFNVGVKGAGGVSLGDQSHLYITHTRFEGNEGVTAGVIAGPDLTNFLVSYAALPSLLCCHSALPPSLPNSQSHAASPPVSRPGAARGVQQHFHPQPLLTKRRRHPHLHRDHSPYPPAPEYGGSRCFAQQPVRSTSLTPPQHPPFSIVPCQLWPSPTPSFCTTRRRTTLAPCCLVTRESTSLMSL